VTDALLNDLKAALGDAYQIERELTGGGMSRVFVAREHALGREVVIKVLPRELAAGMNRERFRREVQLAARLSHPYIVPLLHAGEAGELLWFTMPFIPGESLRHRLERGGPLPVRDTLVMLHDVVEALAYAHARGVVHRDIKPANIMYDPETEAVKVTDFGIARITDSSRTKTGMVLGTPSFMSPEQLAGHKIEGRSDLFSLGASLYQLACGKLPFVGDSLAQLMYRIANEPHIDILSVKPDLPACLVAIIDRSMAKRIEDRYASGAEMAEALRRCAAAQQG
jgi:serine/threonine-protein kinase